MDIIANREINRLWNNQEFKSVLPLLLEQVSREPLYSAYIAVAFKTLKIYNKAALFGILTQILTPMASIPHFLVADCYRLAKWVDLAIPEMHIGLYLCSSDALDIEAQDRTKTALDFLGCSCAVKTDPSAKSDRVFSDLFSNTIRSKDYLSATLDSIAQVTLSNLDKDDDRSHSQLVAITSQKADELSNRGRYWSSIQLLRWLGSFGDPNPRFVLATASCWNLLNVNFPRIARRVDLMNDGQSHKVCQHRLRLEKVNATKPLECITSLHPYRPDNGFSMDFLTKVISEIENTAEPKKPDYLYYYSKIILSILTQYSKSRLNHP